MTYSDNCRITCIAAPIHVSPSQYTLAESHPVLCRIARENPGSIITATQDESHHRADGEAAAARRRGKKKRARHTAPSLYTHTHCIRTLHSHQVPLAAPLRAKFFFFCGLRRGSHIGLGRVAFLRIGGGTSECFFSFILLKIGLRRGI